MLLSALTDDLVQAARNDSRNEDDASATGLGFPDTDITRYFNYAQEHLQSVILKAQPGSFKIDTVINAVSGQEEYTINDRVFSGERIVNIQFSPTGDERDYYDVPQRADEFRFNKMTSGNPMYYIRRSSSFYLNPPPPTSQGLIRLVYERQLDSVAMRAAKVASVSGQDLVLSNINADLSAYFTVDRLICVSDRDGNVLLRNGRIESYNSGTSTLTLEADVSTYMVTGYTTSDLTNVNCYVTIGEYTTTHTKLNPICWRYLIQYVATHLFVKDSSNDFNDYRRELDDMETGILQVYQDAYRDNMDIQLTNPSLVLNDRYGSYWPY